MHIVCDSFTQFGLFLIFAGIQNQKVQTILQNPLFNPSDDANQKQTPLEGYFPSSLRLESRLLPHIQVLQFKSNLFYAILHWD